MEFTKDIYLSRIKPYLVDNKVLFNDSNFDDFFKEVPLEDRSIVYEFIETELRIPVISELTELPTCIFSGLRMPTFTIPKNIKSIAENAFQDSGIQILTVESGNIAKWDADTIGSCDSLREIVFGKSVKRVVLSSDLITDTDCPLEKIKVYDGTSVRTLGNQSSFKGILKKSGVKPVPKEPTPSEEEEVISPEGEEV